MFISFLMLYAHIMSALNYRVSPYSKSSYFISVYPQGRLLKIVFQTALIKFTQ